MKFFLILSMFVFCISCGIKGPPLPPLDENVARKQKAESVTVATPSPQAASSDASKAATKNTKKKIKK